MSNKFVPMSDGVKEFLLKGLEPDDAAMAKQIIEENERNQVSEYCIQLSRCGFLIKNGQIAESWAGSK